MFHAGQIVRHKYFDMVGTVVTPADPLIGKLVLVDWHGWVKAWCGKQAVELI